MNCVQDRRIDSCSRCDIDIGGEGEAVSLDGVDGFVIFLLRGKREKISEDNYIALEFSIIKQDIFLFSFIHKLTYNKTRIFSIPFN